MLRILQLLDGFQGKLYKGKVRKCITGYLISPWTFFWLVDSEVTGWYFGSQSSTPVSLVLCIHCHHAVSLFHLVWFKYLQNNPSICLRTLPIALLEEEPKVPDFVLWLNYYLFVFLVCFPLFLHFPLLWLNLLFGALRQPRSLKPFCKQDTEDTKVCPHEGPSGSCSGKFPEIVIYNQTVEIYKIVIHMLNSPN